MPDGFRMERRVVRVQVVARTMRSGLAARLFVLHRAISRLTEAEVAAAYQSPAILHSVEARLAPDHTVAAWRQADRLITLVAVVAGTLLTSALLGAQLHPGWPMVALAVWACFEVLISPGLFGRAPESRMLALAVLFLAFLSWVEASSAGPAPVMPDLLFFVGLVIVAGVPGVRAVLSLQPGSVTMAETVARSPMASVGLSAVQRARLRSKLAATGDDPAGRT